MDGSHGGETDQDEQANQSRQADQAAERRLLEARSSNHKAGLTHSHQEQPAMEPESSSAASVVGLDNLTFSLGFHSLGSKFAKGLPDKPTCAALLSLGGRPNSSIAMER